MKHNQNFKYLCYVLSTQFVREQIRPTIRKGTVCHIYPKDIKKIKIPLPPREIQNQIVEFLDKFIYIKEEMDIEMNKRNKQYEYYKELIFNRGIEELDWELKKIEQITLRMLSGDSKIAQNCEKIGNFPAISSEDIFNSNVWIEKCKLFVDEKIFKHKYLIEPKDLLILLCDFKTENLGKACAYLCPNKCLAGNHMIVIKHNQNEKYLSHIFSSSFVKEQIKSIYKPSPKPFLNLKDVLKIKISIPDLKTQKEISNFLDKFINFNNEIDLLISKIDKQYECYKEIILTPNS